MSHTLRNFEPGAQWSAEDGKLTERAMGFLRDLFGYIGANLGTIPVETIGGDGVTTTTFLREDGTFAVPAYPVGADPTAQVGTTATNGTAATFMRSDAASAINLGMAPTWTAAHVFTTGTTMTSLVMAGTLTGVTSLTMSGALTGATSLTTTGDITTGSTTLHKTTAALTNGAAAAAGTLLNAPAAGNPTKWAPVDDNGTIRYIPMW